MKRSKRRGKSRERVKTMRYGWMIGMGLAVALAGAACDSTGGGDDDGDDDGEGAGSENGSTTSGGSNEEVCYDVETNTTKGGEACGINQCAAGEYCDGASICLYGCTSMATCAKGEFCDLSEGGPVGTCRQPGSEHEISCSSPSDCGERCAAKATACGAAAQAGSICQTVCANASASQLDCLDAASCSELEDGEECGLAFGTPGEGGNPD